MHRRDFMDLRFVLAALVFLFAPVISFSQAVTLEPEDATVDSTVTIYFDATGGDQGLMDFDGDVYAHTGVITLESTDERDWKHVVADWGTANDTVLMQREGENLYSLAFNIRDFYNIGAGETVLKLAFVFRNADGSLSGRATDGDDLYVQLNNAGQTGYRYFTNTSGLLEVTTTEGVLRFRPYTGGAVKTEFLSRDTASTDSYGIVKEPSSGTFSVDTTDTHLRAGWDDLTLTIQKSPLKVIYEREDTLTVLENIYDGGLGQGGLLDFRLDSAEQFYGGGSRALPLNLRGQRIDFYNQAHYGYANGAANLNTSIPVLVSSKPYGLVFDNHHPGSADIGESQDNLLQYQVQGGSLSFFVLAEDRLSGVSRSLADLSGHAALPPLWSLGYIQSRYGYTDRQQAEQVVEKMQAGDFPLDALVLDLYWFGGTSHMGDFSWDRSRFSQPAEMISNFRQQGIKTIVISEPYFTLESDLYDQAASLGHFATNPNGNPYVLNGFWAGDASLLDMTSPQARDWLWPYYKDLFEMGVAGLWTDLGEPETHPRDMQHEQGTSDQVHNLFNMYWAEMLHDKTRQVYPDKRLFNLTRSGYLGMQRLRTYPWSGDISRSFSGLQAQIPIMLHMSMSGVGYMHSDLGGFTGGHKDPELYTRWLQLGTFSPVMRAHGTGVPPEPIYYDQTTQNRVRKAIGMRYDFLPYNYTLAWKYAEKGLPMARPTNYYHPGLDFLQNINDQYLWGRDLLVAPVIREGVTSRKVTLPPGKWAGYYSGTIHQGHNTVTVEAPMNRIPLFIREGGFLVQSAEKLPHTRAYDSDSIRIRHFLPEEAGVQESYWYHDDGVTAGNLQKDHYNLIRLQSFHRQDTAILTLERTQTGLDAMERQMEYLLYGMDKAPEQVRVNGQSLPFYSAASEYHTQTHAAYWNDTLLHVKFAWGKGPARIKIGPAGEPSPVDAPDDEAISRLMAHPNPFDGFTRLEISLKRQGQYRISLFNMKGQKMGSQQLQLTRGTHQMNLDHLVDDPQRLPAGVYLLVVEGAGEKARLRLVKSPR